MQVFVHIKTVLETYIVRLLDVLTSLDNLIFQLGFWELDSRIKNHSNFYLINFLHYQNFKKYK